MSRPSVTRAEVWNPAWDPGDDAGDALASRLIVVLVNEPGSLGEIFESFSSVGVSQVLDAFVQGVSAAKPVSFDQQLMMFSQTPKPLCWMAV